MLVTQVSLSLRISPEPLDQGGIEESQGPARMKLSNCHFQDKDRRCGQRVSESGSSAERGKEERRCLGEVKEVASKTQIWILRDE